MPTIKTNKPSNPDVDSDGVDEIIAGAGAGARPRVRVFNLQGRALGDFNAFSTTFRGGVTVVVGNVNGDGIDEIIAGAGVGARPRVRTLTMRGRILADWYAYSTTFTGGVRVAAGK